MTRLSETPTRIARAKNYNPRGHIDCYIDNSTVGKHRYRRYMETDGTIRHYYKDLDSLRNKISIEKDDYVKVKDWNGYQPMLTPKVNGISTVIAQHTIPSVTFQINGITIIAHDGDVINTRN